jgi:hypothetical protein
METTLSSRAVLPLRETFPTLALYPAPVRQKQGGRVNASEPQPARDRRGRAFLAFTDWTRFVRNLGDTPNSTVLTSPVVDVTLPANEIIVSWNADAPVGTGLKIEARAWCSEHATKFYTLGLWSKDGQSFPRESVEHQKDADGDVHTDTLALNRPATRLQLRVTLMGKTAPDPDANSKVEKVEAFQPTLKFLGVSLADTHLALNTFSLLEPNRSVWGKEITVPGKTQLGWPGGSGWCSPTSTSMTLAFWARSLNRPELDIPVPDAARAIHDRVYNGTGNWPFNTAFAGSFPGIRAYVTRLSDIRELEDWIAIGIPPIVSVSYDLLKGKPHDNDPGHLMVCDGFTKDGDIVLNDPAHHPERGEVCRRVFPRADFLRGWNRSRYLVYLIYPEGAKVPSDTYGHWESKRDLL